MAAKRLTFDDVSKVGLTLPGAELGTSYGGPALKVHGRMFACMATNKAAEPGSLVLCIDFDQRDELIEADPGTYYLKDHYVGYPCVLVRLSRLHRDALPDLLRMAWQFMSAKGKKKKPASPRGRGARPATIGARARSSGG